MSTPQQRIGTNGSSHPFEDVGAIPAVLSDVGKDFLFPYFSARRGYNRTNFPATMEPLEPRGGSVNG
jgi:hypothetical protein